MIKNTLTYILLLLTVSIACSSTQFVEAGERKYVYSDKDAKIELLLQEHMKFKLWMNIRGGTCYSQGSYFIKSKRLKLKSFIETDDKAYEEIYKIIECEIADSTIEIIDENKIIFNDYILIYRNE